MPINIHSQIKDYSLLFVEDFDFLTTFAQYKPRKIVMDRKVYEHYKSIFDKHFSPDELILIDALETNKTIHSALHLCDELLKSSAKRNLTLISFGGGITQDITGFLASILYRGIEWIFVPTTLLAQSDSCLGAKTSLNYGSYKNLLGSFYPPSKVFLLSAFTQTLSELDFFSGIGEIVKLQLMSAKPLDAIAKEVEDMDKLRSHMTKLRALTKESLEIKYSYVKDDEFDNGKRNLLNYGHCFGHALETTSQYVVPHGVAVMVGMAFANIIATKRGLISAGQADEIWHRILKPCFPMTIQASYLDYNALLEAMKMDKKRVGEGLPLIIRHEDGTLSRLIDVSPIELSEGLDQLKKQLSI